MHRLVRLSLRSVLAAVLLATLSIAQTSVSPPAASADHGGGYGGGYGATPMWIATSSGDVWTFGAAAYGNLKAAPPSQPIVGMTVTPTGGGYWLVARDGGIFSFGDAGFFGSTGAIRLNQPIVAMTPTPTNHGYWLVARDGGIFSFGDAKFFGSTGNITLNQPIVAMVPTPTNNGYWLVASDGGIFSFGDAKFYGSTGNIALQRPITGGAATSDGKGYWLVASDGGIFSFGDAAFYGADPDGAINSVQKIIPTTNGRGYWVVRNGGDADAFGNATSTPRPTLGLFFDVQTKGDAAIAWSFTQLDKPYIWGGNGPVGYDCSGLTSQAWLRSGARIARVANDQYNGATQYAYGDARPGDLIFFGDDLTNSRSIDHVGMYIGNGWGINSGGDSNPSRTAVRDLTHAGSRLFPTVVRPA